MTGFLANGDFSQRSNTTKTLMGEFISHFLFIQSLSFLNYKLLLFFLKIPYLMSFDMRELRV